MTDILKQQDLPTGDDDDNDCDEQDFRTKLTNHVLIPVSSVQTAVILIGILTIFVFCYKREKPRFVKFLWLLIFIGMLINISLITVIVFYNQETNAERLLKVINQLWIFKNLVMQAENWTFVTQYYEVVLRFQYQLEDIETIDEAYEK